MRCWLILGGLALLTACGDVAPPAVPIPPGLPPAVGQVFVTVAPPTPAAVAPADLSTTEQMFATATAAALAQIPARARIAPTVPPVPATDVPASASPPSATPKTPVPTPRPQPTARPAPPTPVPPAPPTKPSRPPVPPPPTPVPVDATSRKRAALQCDYDLQQADNAIARQAQQLAVDRAESKNDFSASGAAAALRVLDDETELARLQLDKEHITKRCALEAAGLDPQTLQNRLAALTCDYSIKDLDLLIARARDAIHQDEALAVHQFGTAGQDAQLRLPDERQHLQDLLDQRDYTVKQCNL